jgi:hypothetical protein
MIVNPPSSLVLSVSLASNPGGAEFFFADVCRLVERVAGIAGLVRGPPTTMSAGSGEVPRVNYAVDAVPDSLVRELGRHRAQYVPPASARAWLPVPG